jgi:hypothetical protein
MSRPVLASRTSICFLVTKAAARTLETKGSVLGKLGSTSTAMRAAPGSSSFNSPSCFVPSSVEFKVTPVTLPPGRLRLATRPSLTGSPPLTKTIGIVVFAALAAIAEGVCSDYCHLAAYQIGCEVGQLIVLVLRPAILDRHILAFDVAGFTNALPECSQKECTIGRPRSR